MSDSAVQPWKEPVALGVVDDAAVPAQGLFPVEVPAHDQAAPPAQPVLRPGRDRPGLDVRVVDDGPDHLTALPRGGDLADLVLDPVLHHGEDFLYMLEGSLEIWLDEVELEQGDSFWFESAESIAGSIRATSQL